jgi:hypothetical protein
MAAQIRCQHSMTGAYELFGYVRVTPTVFGQAMHKHHDRTWVALPVPASLEQLRPVSSLECIFE